MKKSNLLVAVFAVLASVSMARAEAVDMNFDGAAGKPAVSVNEAASSFAGLLAGAKAGQEAAGEVMMPRRAAPVFTARQLAAIDKSIGGALAYAEKNGKKQLKANLDWLLRAGTQEEKFLFTSAAAAKVYKFPEASRPGLTKMTPEEEQGLVWSCWMELIPVCMDFCTNQVGEEEPVCVEMCKDQLSQVCGWI
ncbi:MAG: hypothetical protein A2X35_10040 [Elusimicrobia bacterium GWA2_61_42]|nr:MAG: hypothetical protein A2X35_10040 [Elusimicrobia bacterium GWA2_61_42]OGR76652.1 MAG: hypothetical protein A2X38_03690 [Elusimicrobia bacterium GWC2_61_25]